MVTKLMTEPHACKSGTHRGSCLPGNLQSLQNETPLPQKKNKLTKRHLKSSNIIYDVIALILSVFLLTAMWKVE